MPYHEHDYDEEHFEGTREYQSLDILINKIFYTLQKMNEAILKIMNDSSLKIRESTGPYIQGVAGVRRTTPKLPKGPLCLKVA